MDSTPSVRCIGDRTSVSALWHFDDFDLKEPHRATHLRGSPSWLELVRKTRNALRIALERNAVRFGFDESRRTQVDLRAVIQFPGGIDLFDWLFNGHSGYRAQFRVGQENGLRQNSYLIAELSSELLRSINRPIAARRLSHDFDDLGPMTATVDQLVQSLDPHLSKLWVCEKQIDSSGGIRDLRVSRTGPTLVFPDHRSWASLYPEDDNDGWLDIKGAFIGSGGAYQPKSPEERAATLGARGSA